MTLPITRHTPAAVGYWKQCNFRQKYEKKCDVCSQTQRTDKISRSVCKWSYRQHSQLHYILDAIHNDLHKKKILYKAYAANSLKVNPIVYMKCLLYRTLPNLNTKALLKIKRQT